MNCSHESSSRHRARRYRGRESRRRRCVWRRTPASSPPGTSTSWCPMRPAAALDFFARLIGQKLSDRLGRPVVVENRPGANGNLAAGASHQGGAGRTHAAARLDRDADGQPGGGADAHLRLAARLRADLDDREVSADPDGERQGAGQDRAGARRLCEGQPGEGQRRRRPGRSSRWCRRCSSSAPAPGSSTSRSAPIRRRCWR